MRNRRGHTPSSSSTSIKRMIRQLQRSATLKASLPLLTWLEVSGSPRRKVFSSGLMLTPFLPDSKFYHVRRVESFDFTVETLFFFPDRENGCVICPYQDGPSVCSRVLTSTCLSFMPHSQEGRVRQQPFFRGNCLMTHPHIDTPICQYT